MPEYTERENAFIDGLVVVLLTSSEAYRAERAAEEAMEANTQQIDDLREDQQVSIEDLERYLDEAIERSPFDDHDDIVQATRQSLSLAKQVAARIDDLASGAGNDTLPLL